MCAAEMGQFFGIELLKIYLIDSHVYIFKFGKSYKSLHPNVLVGYIPYFMGV